ncbi:hypothetical protein HanRHA438_Chr05g0237951 [Helianthus annuus]|nr:hypothetical protein HanHA89_Chr05g0202081 [Helianthus annuus]KAJ0920132.1 hypothetical protein HanRHA438_Chr05g0237951 [Helianthus annuus]
MFYSFYFCSKHWSLIIVCPDFKFGYIVDSINEGKTHKSYKLVKIIEEVFEINFKWYMAQLWNEEGYFEESQIENLVVDLMSKLLKRCFDLVSISLCFILL